MNENSNDRSKIAKRIRVTIVVLLTTIGFRAWSGVGCIGTSTGLRISSGRVNKVRTRIAACGEYDTDPFSNLPLTYWFSVGTQGM